MTERRHARVTLMCVDTGSEERVGFIDAYSLDQDTFGASLRTGISG